jgi:hypothetical protein
MSEQGDQWKDREEPQQHGTESPNPSQGGGSEGGTGGSESGTERGTEREGGGQEGTEQGGGSQTGEQDEQPRQGDVEHEGDLGREPGGSEDSQGE